MAKGRVHEAPARRISVGRKGVASLLFAIARPTDAKASALERDALRLTLPIGSRDIAVGEIDAVELQTGWRWGSVRIGAPSGDSVRETSCAPAVGTSTQTPRRSANRRWMSRTCISSWSR